MSKTRTEMTLTDLMTGVFAMSLVSKPANKSGFVALAEEKKCINLSEDDKMEVTGPVLIPDFLMHRNATETNEETDIYFSAETIKEAAMLFLSGDDTANATVEHLVKTDGVMPMESWIIEEGEDKAVELGFDLPVGTWMMRYKVTDDALWEQIKSGSITGFSVEAYFEAEVPKPITLSEELPDFADLSKSDRDEILRYISAKL